MKESPGLLRLCLATASFLAMKEEGLLAMTRFYILGNIDNILKIIYFIIKKGVPHEREDISSIRYCIVIGNGC